MSGINGVFGKIGAWAGFLLSLAAGIGANGAPHGWAGWVALIGGVVSAIGIHAASNVGQQQTNLAGQAVAVKQ